MIRIPKESRILIIEGIAGAGKSTLKESLKVRFKDKNVYEFSEEELLLGWKQAHIPRLSKLRLDFFNRFLDYVEKKLSEENAVFILERFHISLKIIEWDHDKDFEGGYDRILSRIKELPVHILIPKLNESQIKERASHRERNKEWSDYLNEKLRSRGFSDLVSLYVAEQKEIFDIAEKQGIPYSTLKMEGKG
jgi:deoxyadenosine/deoxycytidine kinase